MVLFVLTGLPTAASTIGRWLVVFLLAASEWCPTGSVYKPAALFDTAAEW